MSLYQVLFPQWYFFLRVPTSVFFKSLGSDKRFKFRCDQCPRLFEFAVTRTLKWSEWHWDQRPVVFELSALMPTATFFCIRPAVLTNIV